MKGIAPTYSPQTLLRGEIIKNETVQFPIPENYNTLLYLLDGEIVVNGEEAIAKDMIVFENNGDEIKITAKESTRFMLLSGKPIGEKISQYGPFVMNNQTEIMEALRDSQMGKMGVLINIF